MKTILILAATLAFAAPAIAQEGSPNRIVVSYSDLDLSSQSGQRVLDRRLRAAVRIACGPTSDADPAGKNDVLQCRTETLASARAERDVAIAGRTGAAQIRIAARR